MERPGHGYNDTIPHTVVDMEYQGAECTYPMYLHEVSVVPFRPYDLENFHIFDKGLAKNTFTICTVKRLFCRRPYKYKYFSPTDNTHRRVLYHHQGRPLKKAQPTKNPFALKESKTKGQKQHRLPIYRSLRTAQDIIYEI